MSKETKTKNRYYAAIIYEDDPNFKKYLTNIQKKFYEVTYIKHDRDLKEDENAEEEEEEYKKAHYHVLFKVGESARYINSVAKEIEIPPNYLQGCCKRAMLMYLIHLNSPDKTQYDINEVQGELKSELAEILFKRQPEEQKLAIIMENIIRGNITSCKNLMAFAIESGLNETLRKYQLLFINIMKEKKQEDVNKRLQERVRRREEI